MALRPPTQLHSAPPGCDTHEDDVGRLRAEVESLRERQTVTLRAGSYVRKLYDEVMSAVSIEEAGERLVALTRDVVGTEHASLCLADASGRIAHVFSLGPSPAHLDDFGPQMVGRLVSEWAIWNASVDAPFPTFVEAGTPAEDTGRTGAESWMSSYAVIPLTGSDGPFGLLLCTNNGAHRKWTEHERTAIEEFALQAGLLTENAMLRAVDQHRLYELSYQSFHDPLTKLPNRSLFDDRVLHALTRADRRNEAVAVLVIDIDDFKSINKNLGRQVGDELLVSVGRRIQECLRPEDTIGRFGGDEFAVLIEDLKKDEVVRQIAGRIVSHLEPPFSIEGNDVDVRISVGVSLSWPGCLEPGTLVRNADLAMYRAKSKGKGRIELFDLDRDLPGREGIKAESALRSALEQGELLLHYQPKVDLTSGRVLGFEALIRWDDPSRGMVSPGEFLPLAERSGLIVPIGEWVLETVCFRLRQWIERSGNPFVPTIWFNLCAPEFRQPDLVGNVTDCLARYNVPSDCLGLEITEGTLMDNTDSTIQTLKQLRELGVRLALDDFGAGYSSLSYLKRFQVDVLKIDRSFVMGLLENEEDVAIVSAVTALAGTLGQKVVGEGVETIDQLRRLRELGCDVGQGYYFSRPVPAQEAERLFTGPPIWTV